MGFFRIFGIFRIFRDIFGFSGFFRIFWDISGFSGFFRIFLKFLGFFGIFLDFLDLKEIFDFAIFAIFAIFVKNVHNIEVFAHQALTRCGCNCGNYGSCGSIAALPCVRCGKLSGAEALRMWRKDRGGIAGCAEFRWSWRPPASISIHWTDNSFTTI